MVAAAQSLKEVNALMSSYKLEHPEGGNQTDPSMAHAIDMLQKQMKQQEVGPNHREQPYFTSKTKQNDLT